MGSLFAPIGDPRCDLSQADRDIEKDEIEKMKNVWKHWLFSRYLTIIALLVTRIMLHYVQPIIKAPEEALPSNAY